jgi:hypothetical protein
MGAWDGRMGWARGMGAWDEHMGWAHGMSTWDGRMGWAHGMGAWDGRSFPDSQQVVLAPPKLIRSIYLGGKICIQELVSSSYANFTCPSHETVVDTTYYADEYFDINFNDPMMAFLALFVVMVKSVDATWSSW